MRKYYTLRKFTILGAKLSIHWSVFVAILIISISAVRSPIYAVVAILSYFGILFIHEFGHALVARRLHLEVSSIKIGLVHGLCECEPSENEWEECLVSWGGVMAQFFVCFIIFIVVKFSNASSFGYAGPIVAFLGYINLLVAFINLAPSPRLDGYKAWKIFPLLLHRLRAKKVTNEIVKKLKNVR